MKQEHHFTSLPIVSLSVWSLKFDNTAGSCRELGLFTCCQTLPVLLKGLVFHHYLSPTSPIASTPRVSWSLALNLSLTLGQIVQGHPTLIEKKIGRYRLPLHRYFIIPSSYHCLPSSSLYLSSLTAILLPYHCPLIACSLTCPPPGISAPTSIHLSIALPQNVPSSLQWRLLRNSRMPAASR